MRDGRIPERVRNTLNVEAGYNDGIISPIFIFALVRAGDHSHAETPVEAIGAALTSRSSDYAGRRTSAGNSNCAGRRRLPADGRDVFRVTSIVLGLLAFNVLSDEAESEVLLTMVVTVLGSVLVHGIGAPAAARAFNRREPNRMSP